MESTRRKEIIMIGVYMVISSIVRGVFEIEGIKALVVNFIIIMAILAITNLFLTKEEQEFWVNRPIRAAVCNVVTGGSIAGVFIIMSVAFIKGCFNMGTVLMVVLTTLTAKISYDEGNRCYYKRA